MRRIVSLFPLLAASAWAQCAGGAGVITSPSTCGGCSGGGGGGGSVSWGAIVGTLGNQLDLAAALNAKQNTIASYATISGLLGYPSAFNPVNTGDWAGTWQTHQPSYFQPALTAYSTISGLSGYPSTFPPINSGDWTGTWRTHGPSYFQTASSVVASDYNFPPQTPGVSLTSGVSATVTLSPVPYGVNGTDSGHYLYISGGSGGAAEPVLIVGGTAMSGASSGTIVFTPANNHSGFYTISSATAGIQEACAFGATNGNHVIVPPGDYDIYATITPALGCTVNGLGSPAANGPSGAVTLHMQTQGIPLFNIVNFATTIKNIQLMFGSFPAYTVGGSAAGTGSVGIQSGVTGAIDQPQIENVIINNFYVNQIAQNGAVLDRNVQSLAAISDCYQMGGAGGARLNYGAMEYVQAGQCGGNGFTLNGEAPLQWHNVNAFNNHGWGMQINPGAAFQMDTVDMQEDYLGEINIVSPVNTVGLLQNVILEWGGSTTLWGTNTTAPGLQVTAGSAIGLTLVNAQISAMQGDGIDLGGDQANLSNVVVGSVGLGGVVGHQYCLNITGTRNQLSGAMCNNGGTGESYIAGNLNSISDSWFFSVDNANPVVAFSGGIIGNRFCNNLVSNFGTGGSINWGTGTQAAQCTNELYGTVTGSPTAETTYLSTWTIPVAPLYAPTGTQQLGAHTVAGTCTLGTNCAVSFVGSSAWASSSSYQCTGTDQTSAAAVKVVNTSGVVATFTGTGSDVISFVCAGN